MRDVPASLAEKLTASTDAFATSFDEVRMDDIARASGIPRATLYYYFAGKDDILAFLLSAALSEFAVRQSAIARTGGDAWSRLRALVATQLRLLAARPATVHLLLANLGRAGTLPEIAHAIDEAFYAPLESILSEGIASGEVRDGDPSLAAAMLFGGVMMAGLHALVQGRAVDAEGLADDLLERYRHGLAAGGALVAAGRAAAASGSGR